MNWKILSFTGWSSLYIIAKEVLDFPSWDTDTTDEKQFMPGHVAQGRMNKLQMFVPMLEMGWRVQFVPTFLP
jgi:hypothetical protein